jgi:hypothetical protein
MAVRLSALRASRALPQEGSSGNHFCYSMSKHQGHVAGKLKKKFNDLIGTRKEN